MISNLYYVINVINLLGEYMKYSIYNSSEVKFKLDVFH